MWASKMQIMIVLVSGRIEHRVLDADLKYWAGSGGSRWFWEGALSFEIA